MKLPNKFIHLVIIKESNVLKQIHTLKNVVQGNWCRQNNKIDSSSFPIIEDSIEKYYNAVMCIVNCDY